MGREKFKTILLSVLVMISLVLTHKIWFGSPMVFLQSEARSEKEDQLLIGELREGLIAPNRIVLGFGGDRLGGGLSNNDYSILTGAEMRVAWQEAKGLLLDFFIMEPTVTPIEYSEYIQNFQNQFMELEFGEQIPSVLVSGVFGEYNGVIVNNIREIKKILIPVYNKGSIFIIGKDKNVFHVKLENYSDTRLKTYLDAYAEKPYVKYHSLFMNAANNPTLMPLVFQQEIPNYFVASEINVQLEQQVIDRSKTFFNENFDFVKTIKETSGAVVYLYGYGEKSVRINSKGRLEYNQEIKSISSTNALEAFDLAVEFVQQHGGFPEGSYLKEVSVDNDKQKSYYFGFGYDMGSYPIISLGNNMKHPIEVEVVGNQIKTYRRFVRQRMDLTALPSGEAVITPRNIIEMNLDMIKENYLQDQPERETELEVIEILENVGSSQLVYFDPSERILMEQLYPSWRLEIKNRIYYFDTFTGELLYMQSRRVDGGV